MNWAGKRVIFNLPKLRLFVATPPQRTHTLPSAGYSLLSACRGQQDHFQRFAPLGDLGFMRYNKIRRGKAIWSLQPGKTVAFADPGRAMQLFLCYLAFTE
jgi:hypothetical protein